MSRTRSSTVAGPASPAIVHRALVQDMTEAAERIAAHRRLTPTEVHDTRKRIKRMRAALALLRPALAEKDVVVCDRALREAGRGLAAARDATVMAKTYAKVRARSAGAARPSPRAATTAAPGLAEVARAHRQLLAGAGRLARTKVGRRGWTPLGEGVRAVYRRARRRMPLNGADASSDALHAWRRHTKRYWHVLELFEAVNPVRLEPRIAAARRLSDLLGEEHDLALLAECIRNRRARPEPDDGQVLPTIAARRAKLARRALKLGAGVFADRPKAVEHRLRDDWEQWRRSTPQKRSVSRASRTAATAGDQGRGRKASGASLGSSVRVNSRDSM